MTLDLRLRPRARKDLAEIWLYTRGRWSEQQADTYIRGLHAIFDKVCEFPALARRNEDVAPQIRIHPYGSHVIAYRISGRSILIVRVLHARSNWQALLHHP